MAQKEPTKELSKETVRFRSRYRRYLTHTDSRDEKGRHRKIQFDQFFLETSDPEIIAALRKDPVVTEMKDPTSPSSVKGA